MKSSMQNWSKKSTMKTKICNNSPKLNKPKFNIKWEDSFQIMDISLLTHNKPMEVIPNKVFSNKTLHYPKK